MGSILVDPFLKHKYTVSTQCTYDKESIMKRDAIIRARATQLVKEQAEAVYGSWGLSLSDAINIFLIKSIRTGGFPFEVTGSQINYMDSSTLMAVSKTDDDLLVVPSEWRDDDD